MTDEQLREKLRKWWNMTNSNEAHQFGNSCSERGDDAELMYAVASAAYHFYHSRDEEVGKLRDALEEMQVIQPFEEDK